MKLYDYQIEGIGKMVASKKIINGDQMGLGKTVQTIMSIEKSQAFPCIVVCPASLKYNWQKEIEMWTNHKALILSNETKKSFIYFYQANLVHYFIVNYESISKFFVSENFTQQKFELKDVVFKPEKNFFKSIVFDEAHRLNNPLTRQTKLSYGLSYQKEYCYLLTGTPIVNKVNDLASLLCFVDGINSFGGYTKFLETYQNANSQKLKDLGEKIRLNNLYIRREKSQVLELPEKTRQLLLVEIDNKTEYYTAQNDLAGYLKEYKNKTDKEIRKSMRGEVMVRLSELRQCAARGKMYAVKELIQNCIDNDEKTIIFGVHKEILKSIRDEFKSLYIAGEVSSEQRQAAVEKFQNDENEKTFVLSLKSGGVGLTLTAGRIEIFVEMWWNPATNEQAEDRGHRIGQKRDVHCIYPVAKGTVDEYLWKLVEDKRNVANSVMLSDDEIEWQIIDELINILTDERN
jgi:SWI/SNF-related matrix-associated actin-dependent regulator of chromatin subfamily A-like protein 1